jgi:hypothetical protein
MKEQLLELMQNSADNGQPVWDWRPDEVAWEIKAYVDEVAEVNTDEMAAIIKEIQGEQNNESTR